MSTLKLENIKHENSSSNNLVLDSDGNVTINGNVGIGTSSPSDKLVVQQDASGVQPMLVLKNDNTTDDNGVSLDFSGKDTSNNNITYGRIAAKYTNHSTEKSHMIFSHRDNSGSFSEWMRATHDGRVGIGTSSPSTLLHLSKGSTNTVGGGDAGITMTNKYDTPDNSWAIKPQITGISNTGLEIRDVTDSRTDMSFTGSGAITTPNQPTFSAQGSTQQTVSNNGSNAIIEYPTVEWNTGNSYNNSTYRFTAPVSGKYFFKAWFMLNGGATSWSYSFIRFVVNNTSSNSEFMHNRRDSTFMTMQGSVILNLSAGDYVDVQARNASGNSDFTIRNDFRGFQGYLIG